MNNMNLRAKLLVYVLVTTFAVLATVGVYIQYRTYRMAINDAHKIAENYVEKMAHQIRAELELDVGFSKALAHTLQGYHQYDEVTRDSFLLTMSRSLVEHNPRYITVWFSYEFSAIIPNYPHSYGRRSTIVFLENGIPTETIESLNLTGDILTSEYYKAKTLNQELVLNPYLYSVGSKGDVLMTSVCVPIQQEGAFIGLAGVDILLEKFQDNLDQTHFYKGTQTFLLSNNGVVIAHTNPLNTSKGFQEVYPEIEMQHGILEKVKRGSAYNFDWHDGESRFLNYVIPLQIGLSPEQWAVGVSIPYNEITKEAKNSMLSGIYVAILGLGILSLVIFLIAASITKPIIHTTTALNALANGEIDSSLKLQTTSTDELGQMAQSFNQLIDGLNQTELFAIEIERGNLDVEYKLLGEKDRLGLSLVAMQKSLQNAKEVEEQRKVEEEKLNWSTQGVAKFADILRQNNDNLHELSYGIIQNLVDYTQSNQGGMFVLNENDPQNPLLEMLACYAFDRRKYLEKTVEIGEGLVGRCFKEGKKIFMTDIPEDYINISSGLGTARPRCLLLVPLKMNDVTLGVMELASFNVYEPYEIEFIEKLAESIASTISSTRINIKTAELLAKSQQQAEEMLAQEEEMRQNMEELQATQEEMERKTREQENLYSELLEEASLLTSLMENCPDYIFFKDSNGRYSRVSRSMTTLFNTASVEDIVGKTDFNLQATDRAEKCSQREQEVLRTGIPSFSNMEQYFLSNGEVQWLSTAIMPLQSSDGHTVGVWGISRIVTDQKEAEERVQEYEKKLVEAKGKPTVNQGEFKAITQAVESATFLAEYTPQGEILRINEQLLAVLGKSAQEVVGKHHEEFFRTKSDDDSSYENFWDELRRGNMQQKVFKGVIGTTRITLNETYSPAIDEEGNVEKIVAIGIRG